MHVKYKVKAKKKCICFQKKKDRDNNKTMKTNIDSNILIFWQKQRILQNIVNMSDTCSELMVKNNHTQLSDSYQNNFFRRLQLGQIF